ncbi:hypothetical protein, partial [Thiolapillus sp.]|uniref:hypothetical protein n=1 Tax=Thiolapillus sp. TaxID=2017437 RepID=UPI003AF973DD
IKHKIFEELVPSVSRQQKIKLEPGDNSSGAERERERTQNSELRTLLLKDKDFRHLPILTICPC